MKPHKIVKRYKSLKQAYRAGESTFLESRQASTPISMPSEQRIAFYNGYYDAKIHHDIGDALVRMTGRGWDREEPVG